MQHEHTCCVVCIQIDNRDHTLVRYKVQTDDTSHKPNLSQELILWCECMRYVIAGHRDRYTNDDRIHHHTEIPAINIRLYIQIDNQSPTLKLGLC